MRNDKGGFSVPSPRLLKARHILYAEARVMGVLMLIAAWGWGTLLPIPPPPRRIYHRSPKNACNTTGWVHGHARFAACVCAPPRTQMNTSVIKRQKDLDDLTLNRMASRHY
jgi:hypothetical protein